MFLDLFKQDTKSSIEDCVVELKSKLNCFFVVCKCDNVIPMLDQSVPFHSEFYPLFWQWIDLEFQLNNKWIARVSNIY